MEVWKSKACNICKTGTKKLIAIQFNECQNISSLMKIYELFSRQTLNNALFKNIHEKKILTWNDYEINLWQ